MLAVLSNNTTCRCRVSRRTVLYGWSHIPYHLSMHLALWIVVLHIAAQCYGWCAWCCQSHYRLLHVWAYTLFGCTGTCLASGVKLGAADMWGLPPA